MRRLGLALLVLGLLLLPRLAAAQVLAGVVKDTSGAVLPGVTVEAASSALIEKVRSVVDRRQPASTRSSTSGRAHTP